MMKVKKPPAAAGYESVNYEPTSYGQVSYGRPEGAKDTYEEEYKEFNSYFQDAIEDTRQKLLAAGCRSAAKRLKKHMEPFNTGIASMRLLGVDWFGVINSLLEQYCRDSIINQVKNTPMKDRGKWTADILDTKIDACGLDEAARVEIYTIAGLDPRKQTVRISKMHLRYTEPGTVAAPCYKKAVSG